MWWDAVTAISTAITAIVLAGTGIFIAVQAKELKRSAYAEAFATIPKLLDNEKARMARCILMTNSKKDFNCWNQPEINDAEFVCSLYGSVGSMVRNKFIPQKIIIDEWGYSIRRCYEQARPMIDEYRKLCGIILERKIIGLIFNGYTTKLKNNCGESITRKLTAILRTTKLSPES